MRVGRMRVWGGLLPVVVLVGVVGVGTAGAQETPTISPVEIEQVETPVIDYDANQAGIDRSRRALVGIAIVLSVALVAFWWHTKPSRRLRVYAKRLAKQRETSRP